MQSTAPISLADSARCDRWSWPSSAGGSPFFVGDRLRTGMSTSRCGPKIDARRIIPLHKRDVLFAQRRIGYRDVELAAERQVAGPDFQSGFFEQRLDAVGRV